MNIKEYDIKLSIIIVLILGTVLSTTYAFLNLQANNNSDSSIAGCFEVNYEGTVLSDNLTSTNNYLEGTHAQITLSKDESCKIYTQATIYVHTTSTTAPINETQALKYKVLSGSTTLAEGFITNNNGSDKSLTTVTLSDTPTTYDIYIWVDKTLADGQYNGKTYSGYIYASSDQTSTITPINDFTEQIMKPGASSDSNIDFSVASNTSNTNGVYIRSGTENNNYPIYYYRGNVNNNLIFAGFCWKVVRSTETGGLKLLYNGVPSNNQCNNTGTATTIGANVYNENSNSPAYVGYMYGTPYPADYRSIGSSTQYVYGNGVNYSNGVYTLTNTITDTWSNLYETGLPNHHYTCFSSGTTCESVYYIYITTETEIYYLTLTGINNIETALSQMLDNNTYSSTIKGDKDTVGSLDHWYYTNIEQKGYSSYIEDTIWCYDRSIHSLGGFNPNGGETIYGTNSVLKYAASWEKFETKTSNLNCSRNIDKFTVSESNGNGALDYPVGILNHDEMIFAGIEPNSANPVNNTKTYVNNNNIYWNYIPRSFTWESASFLSIISGRLESFELENYTITVRPSVSLKPGFSLTGNGNGTATNPYKVE